MNEANYDYLLKSLLDAKFPYRIRHPLREQLLLQPMAFVLPCNIFYQRHLLETTIYFRKWQDCPLYYLHKYHAVLCKRNGDRLMGQDFFFGKMYPVIKATEAVQLFRGQSVFRNSCHYRDRIYTNSWLSLDMSRTDALGNFVWQFDAQPKVLSK